jgi:hypothetical protein
VNFVFRRSVRRLIVTANVFPSSPILVTLMMEAIRSSETLVLARVTRRNIPADGSVAGRNMSPVMYELGFYVPGDDILNSHRCENLKSYKHI